MSDSSQTRSVHESETFNVEDEIFSKRNGRSVADHDVSHESLMVNEADMDFRIPGLPHSVVTYAQSTGVREFIQKIENHPDRHALQQDLRQNQSFHLLSRFKTIDSGCGLTSNVNCSRRNPKRSAEYVYFAGALASSIARAGHSCVKKGQSTIRQLCGGSSFSP